MSFTAHLSISLPKPMTGKQIATLVEKVAKDEYLQEIALFDDDGEHYEIGARSEQSYRDLVIAVGDPSVHTLMLEQTYDLIFVAHKKRDKGDMDHNHKDIINAVSEFRTALQREIEAEQSKNHRSNGRKVTFDWKGARYEVDAVVARDLNKIVLSDDGTVLDVVNWFEGGELPQPIDFKEIPYLDKGDRTAEEIAIQVEGVVAEPV